jgi:hypothetical protein
MDGKERRSAREGPRVHVWLRAKQRKMHLWMIPGVEVQDGWWMPACFDQISPGVIWHASNQGLRLHPYRFEPIAWARGFPGGQKPRE